jgi:DNA modification methylase
MIRIIVGDALTRLREIPDGTFQTCVTSPPYMGLRSYLPNGHADKAREVGAEPTPDAYVAALVEVFREVRRTLRDDATVWLNLGDCYSDGGTGANGRQRNAPNANRDGTRDNKAPLGVLPPRMDGAKPKDLLGIPWLVAFALRADGWFLRSAIVWAKVNPMPESVTDRPTSSYEHVFLLAKRAIYFIDMDAIADEAKTAGKEGLGFYSNRAVAMGRTPSGNESANPRLGIRSLTRNARNVWTIATQPYGGAHFATMPPELADRCIRAGTSERGACPHCGAPWIRETSRSTETPTIAPSEIDRFGTGDAGVHRKIGGQYQKWLDANPKQTTGWSQSCACPTHAPVPQAVLDPFGGAGTTALVADRLGRDATIIELNPAYAALARQRIEGDAPLFAQVETHALFAEAAE